MAQARTALLPLGQYGRYAPIETGTANQKTLIKTTVYPKGTI